MVSWFSIALGYSAVALTLVSAGCAAHAGLPKYSAVPDFSLTDQTGAAFDRAAKLQGKIWVADFIYTTCPGPCPRMTSQMHEAQTGLTGVDDVRLVSFTVDPENDTPAVLADYAKRFKADPAVWSFLTGPRDAIHHLSRDVFMLSDVDGNLEHSTRFVLVDRASRIRGFYLTSEPDAITRLISDARTLAREKN